MFRVPARYGCPVARGSRGARGSQVPASFKPDRGEVAVFRAAFSGPCSACDLPIMASRDYVCMSKAAPRPGQGLGLSTKPSYVHAIPCAERSGLQISTAARLAGIPAAGTGPTPAPARSPRRSGAGFEIRRRPGELRSMVARRDGSCAACEAPVHAETDVICRWELQRSTSRRMVRLSGSTRHARMPERCLYPRP